MPKATSPEETGARAPRRPRTGRSRRLPDSPGQGPRRRPVRHLAGGRHRRSAGGVASATRTGVHTGRRPNPAPSSPTPATPPRTPSRPPPQPARPPSSPWTPAAPPSPPPSPHGTPPPPTPPAPPPSRPATGRTRRPPPSPPPPRAAHLHERHRRTAQGSPHHPREPHRPDHRAHCGLGVDGTRPHPPHASAPPHSWCRQRPGLRALVRLGRRVRLRRAGLHLGPPRIRRNHAVHVGPHRIQRA